jgi:CheY-like chemotaxis protein
MIQKTVLVVDDEVAILEALESVLADLGHRVSCAQNGRVALDLLERGLSPNVIITDLMMPVVNGFELISSLQRRSEWKGIPVIVASANRGYEGSDLRVSAVLRKPFSLEELFRCLDDVFEPKQ